MIERNKHPAGRFSNFVFGVAQLCDGLVRVLSLGLLHTRLMVTVTRYQSERFIERLKSGAIPRAGASRAQSAPTIRSGE